MLSGTLSGCSKHMIGDETLSSSFTTKKKGFVFYNDNNKGKILGIGIVGMSPRPMIDEVLLVENLKYNWSIISQLYDKGNNVTFHSSGCRVIKSKLNQTLFSNSRSGNTYKVNLNKIPSTNVCRSSRLTFLKQHIMRCVPKKETSKGSLLRRKCCFYKSTLTTLTYGSFFPIQNCMSWWYD